MKQKRAEQVPPAAWIVYSKIKAILEALPDTLEFPAFVLGIRLQPEIAVTRGIPNCHMVAHAFARLLPVEAHDGVVTVHNSAGKPNRFQHSWLTMRGGDSSVIIDPWPLGAASGPAVFIQDEVFYFETDGGFLDLNKAEFVSCVETLTEAIQAVNEKLELCTH